MLLLMYTLPLGKEDFMPSRAAAWRVVGLAVPVFVVACSDTFDTTRSPPPRGTLGAEFFGVVCDRVGAQSLHEDLTGASYHDICHPRSDGTYADQVDTSALPPVVAGAMGANGQPVPLAQQQSDRNYGIARVQTLAQHRSAVIGAIDATFPDTQVPIKDLSNPDPTQTCAAPAAGGEGSYHTELTGLLERMTTLYDDGTIPQQTEAVARVIDAFKASPEAQTAWAVYDARAGYRPIDINLGAVRPTIAYSDLREFTNVTLSLLSIDSQPYSGSLVPGAAYPQLSQLVATSHAELLNSTPDPAPALLATSTDAITGRTVLSRPRTDLEFLQTLFYAQNPVFGGGESRYIVQRDPRGYVTVPLVGGKVPPPFVDTNGDGLPDVDGTGAFVTNSGSPAPSPFYAVGAPDALARDASSRALASPGGPLLYGFIDTSHTYTATLVHNLQPLLDPNPQDSHETVMDMLSGAEVVLGTRKPNTAKTYADGETVTYSAYDTTKSPMLDLLYAFGNILADPTTDDTLTFVKTLVTQNPGAVARMMGDGLYAKSLANMDTMGKLPSTSTFWDDMIDVTIQIEQEPGLLEDVLRALGDDASLPLSQSFSAYMQDLDHISYDRNNLNGPAFNETTNNGSPPSSPVNRGQPDTSTNRSEMQRFLQAIYDTNGVTACNKTGAVVHAQGVPLLGTIDVPAGPANNVLAAGILAAHYGSKTTFNACEVFKIENLAAFYLDSIVGAANMYFRDDFLRNGLGGIGAATVGLIEQSSGLGYDPNNADTYNGSDLSKPGFWDTSGSMSFRPKPGWLNRLVFFDIAKDSPNPGDKNYTTNHFLSDLQGTQIGTSICPENVIPDPCYQSSTCGDATDIASNHMIEGLRSCPTGDWAFNRDQDATFVWEELGFYQSITPLVTAFSLAKNPTTGQPRHREDLFIALMNVLNKHWQSAQGAAANPNECALAVDSTGKATSTCSQDGADSYEPLLSQIFSSDMLTALNAFMKVVEGISIPTCAKADPTTGACTMAGPSTNGVSILANATRALVDPARAKAVGLVDNHGNVTSQRNDGTTNPQVTPIYLVLEALDEIDQAFAAYAQANPNDTGRQAQWRLARSQLVDQFLGVNGENTPMQSFQDPSLPQILPVIVDTVRAQVAAHCPGPPYGACSWARQQLTQNAAATVGGPTFASFIDLTEAIRKNDTARAELEKLLTYLADAGSNNDALAEFLATADDLIQVMRDDANLVPLYHVLATAAEPTTTDANGNTQRGVVDATTALLAKIAGHAYQGNSNVEICSSEIDPEGLVDIALANLVTPMKDANGNPTETPLEVFLDAIADVNRASPGTQGPMQGTDLANAANELSEFLLDPQRGLEQYYAIVRNGTVH
jgi:hypothetical protein